MTSPSLIAQYLTTLNTVTTAAAVTDLSGAESDLDHAVKAMGLRMRQAHEAGNKIMFVGNGGSAGISSHMAIDCSKNGGMRSLAFNDGAALTCLGNDLGYDQVFAEQVRLHARADDVLVAISSSGRSASIINAAASAREAGCIIYTFTGFDGDNPLQRLGDLNVHLASHQYGFVEVGHLSILHAVLDVETGWEPTK